MQNAKDRLFRGSAMDRWSRKKIPQRLHNWPKKKPLDFSGELDATKPSNPGHRTISAKRVSSKTLETPFDLSQKSRSKWKKWISCDPRRRHISPFAKTDPSWQSFELKYRKPIFRNSIFNPHGCTVMDWRCEKVNLFFQSSPKDEIYHRTDTFQ